MWVLYVILRERPMSRETKGELMRSFSVFGIAWALLTLGGVISAAPAESGEAAFPLAAALEAAGDYEAALTQYESFLEEHPDDPKSPLAVFAAANIRYLQFEDYEPAIVMYQRLLEDYAASQWAPEAARRKGECLQVLERWIEAGEAFGRALEHAGKSSRPIPTEWVNEVSLLAADCFYEAGDRTAVIGMYEKTLRGDLAPSAAASVLYRLGDSYESMGEEERAAQTYARIVREYPFSSVFAQAMDKCGLIDEHVSLDWAHYETYARTSQDFARGDYDGALGRCDTILGSTDNQILRDCADYRRVVAHMLLHGDFSHGVESLEALLDSLADPRILPNAPRQLEGFRVVADQEATVRRQPGNPETMRALGQSYLRARSFAKAIETLERALTLSEEDAMTHLPLGVAYASAGRTDDAEDAFTFYLERNPTEVGAMNWIGYTFLGQGDTERALSYFQRYVDVAPEDANAHDSYGEGLLSAGRLEEAAGEYERAIELDSLFTNSHFMLGTVYQQMGDTAKALAAYRGFLELSPQGRQAQQAQQAIRGFNLE